MSGSSHIDGTTQNGLFNNTVVADPGFGSGQRVLPSAVEIYGLCVIEGCTANQVNTNISAVPVPTTIWLFCSALAGVIGFTRRRSSLVAAKGLV